MVEYLPSIAQVEVAAAGRAAHEMFGCIFWLVAYAARAILAKAAQHHAGHIVARARESSCACFRAMECRSPWRASRPRISNSTRRRGPGRCEPCEFLMFGTAVSKSGVAVGPSGHANSPHPSSREGHHSTVRWSSSFLLLGLILGGLHAAAAACSRVPAELSAVNPDAVHDHGQPAGQRDDRLFHPAAPGDLHRPSLEPRPFLRTQHALRCFVKHDPHHLIAAA